LAPIRLNGKWGFVDPKGNQIVLPKYDAVGYFADCGLAYVELNKKVGLINREGKEIVVPKYDSMWFASFLREGFIGLTSSGKKGFVDMHGNEYFNF
jgi:hypothetical protein